MNGEAESQEAWGLPPSHLAVVGEASLLVSGPHTAQEEFLVCCRSATLGPMAAQTGDGLLRKHAERAALGQMAPWVQQFYRPEGWLQARHERRRNINRSTGAAIDPHFSFVTKATELHGMHRCTPTACQP